MGAPTEQPADGTVYRIATKWWGGVSKVSCRVWRPGAGVDACPTTFSSQARAASKRWIRLASVGGSDRLQAMIAVRWVLLFLWLPLAAQTSANIPQLEALAKERLAARDASRALAIYEKLAELNPASATYQDQIGFLMAATNRSPEAIPHFQRATELDPKMAQAWYHLGVALWLAQKPKPAVVALEKAAILAPEKGDYQYHLGVAYAHTGRYRQAIAELTRASKQVAGNADVWTTLGNCYQELSRYQEARDAYRQAIRLRSKERQTRNGYGNALVQIGRPGRGIEGISGDLRARPGQLPCASQSWLCLHRAGD